MVFQNEVRGREKYQCLKSQCADCHSPPCVSGFVTPVKIARLLYSVLLYSHVPRDRDCLLLLSASTRLQTVSREAAAGTIVRGGKARKFRDRNHKSRRPSSTPDTTLSGLLRTRTIDFFSAAAVKRDLVGVPGSSANGNGCTSAIVRRGFRRNGKLHRSAGSVRIRIRKRFRIFGERILQFLFRERYFSVTPNGKLEIRLSRLNLSSDCLTNGTEKERGKFKFGIIY